MKKKKIHLSSLLNRIKFELRTIDKKKMFIGACAALVVGVLSRIWTGRARYPVNYYIPRFMPSLLMLAIGQIFICVLSGMILGAVIGCEEKCKRDCRNQGLLHLILVIIFTFTWYPLFFGAYAYFAALIAVIAMCVFCFFAMMNIVKVYFVCGFMLALELLLLIYFLIENVTYILIN